MGVWRVTSAPNPFTHEQALLIAAVDDRGCRSQRLRLQIAALQSNRANTFHLIERAATVDAAMVA
jgi:hypothetical protein